MYMTVHALPLRPFTKPTLQDGHFNPFGGSSKESSTTFGISLKHLPHAARQQGLLGCVLPRFLLVSWATVGKNKGVVAACSISWASYFGLFAKQSGYKGSVKRRVSAKKGLSRTAVAKPLRTRLCKPSGCLAVFVFRLRPTNYTL